MSDQRTARGPGTENIEAKQIFFWLEFGCWSALVVAPLIYWMQGRSVSHDQFVVRTALIIIAAVVAIGLRIKAVLERNRRLSAPNSTQQSEAPDTSQAESQE